MLKCFVVSRLHEACLPNVNGNWSLGTPRPEAPTADGLYINVVPNIYERLDKDVRPFDSFKKYSVSEGRLFNIKIHAKTSFLVSFSLLIFRLSFLGFWDFQELI